MVCTSCGKQIDKDDLFCIHCGEKIINNSQEEFESKTSKEQNDFKKVKTKTEVIRDKSKLLSTIKDAQNNKARVLAELGLLTYEKIRLGEINNDELNNICKSILEFDSIIYKNSIKIEDLEKLNEKRVCDCGTNINDNAKFCIECGKKVEIPVDTKVFNTCIHCEARVEEDSKFCPCCGNIM